MSNVADLDDASTAENNTHSKIIQLLSLFIKVLNIKLLHRVFKFLKCTFFTEPKSTQLDGLFDGISNFKHMASDVLKCIDDVVCGFIAHENIS